MPFDIDYNIMMSFGEFYQALLRFVNFKLYKDAGLEYPPKVLDGLNLSSNTVFSLIQPFIRDTQQQLLQKAQAEGAGALMASNPALTQFEKFRFYLNRETPIYSLEMVLLSSGCELGFDGETSSFDESAEGVTHQIVDRPIASEDMRSNREYVQPQWVFDCLNHGITLPTSPYYPGKVFSSSTDP
jgi:pescadillo protein